MNKRNWLFLTWARTPIIHPTTFSQKLPIKKKKKPYPTKIAWWNCSFDGHITTCKIWNLNLQQFYRYKSGQKHFRLSLKKHIFHRHIVFAESLRQLWCIIENRKKHSDETFFFFSKFILLIWYFRGLRACLNKANKNYVIKL